MPPLVLTVMVLVPSVVRLGQVKLTVVAVTVAVTAVPPMVTVVEKFRFVPVRVTVDPVSAPLAPRLVVTDVIVGGGGNTLVVPTYTALAGVAPTYAAEIAEEP